MAILDEKVPGLWFWYSAGPVREADSFEEATVGQEFSSKWLHSNYDEDHERYSVDCHWRKTCTHLVDNKIYMCPIIAYWKYFDMQFEGQHNFVIKDEDAIHLDKLETGYIGLITVNDKTKVNFLKKYTNCHFQIHESEKTKYQFSAYFSNYDSLRKYCDLAFEKTS